MKLREFLVKVDEILSDRMSGPVTLRDVDTLFRAFVDQLERRAKIDRDGIAAAREITGKLRAEVAARFVEHTSKAPLSEADPLFVVLKHLEALATRERDKWWRRRA
jgi:hypothetical protein